MFKELVDAFNEDDDIIRKYRNQFNDSSLYASKVKRVLSLDIEWYIVTKMIEPILRNLNFKSSLVSELKNISNINLSNLVIDWYNYFESGGREEDVPIKGIMASFNTGDPLLLSPYLSGANKSDRVFYDFITYLNRTELSIFGFEYYKSYMDNNNAWTIGDIFINKNILTNKDNLTEGEGPIKNKLMNIMKCTKFPNLSEDIIRDNTKLLFDAIIRQDDVS